MKVMKKSNPAKRLFTSKICLLFKKELSYICSFGHCFYYNTIVLTKVISEIFNIVPTKLDKKHKCSGDLEIMSARYHSNELGEDNHHNQ